jgi:WD40 repeat protein/energy-coupling factor transporter ATP-binding protein EcfA2
MSDKDMNLTQGQAQDIIDITELINPFPGLRPFGIEEGHLFFGREGQSDEVLVKLAENKFVGILGASGSGKSSFMYCGLVPSLVGGFMTEAGSNWRVVVARPGGGPIDNLAEALLIKDKEYSNLSEEDKLIKKTIIGTVLRSSSLGLVEVIKQLKTDNDQNMLIVIDQFEELFRFRKLEAATSDMDESSAFVNLLLEAIHQFDEPIYITITMRSDFIGECAKFPDLTQMINDSHYLIPQMTRDQKRVAIEGPVAVGGGKIAPRLTQQLLNDVGDNPDQLPILQHALMRTWANWVDTRKPNELMDLRHYNAIGTLREALSQHANEAYDSLSKREKEICEVMFKSLTERGNENQGIRRPTKLGTIAAIAGVTEDEVSRVVEKFREPGRSLLMPPYGVRLDTETVIDISHESLMRIWDRLKRWLDEESKAAEMYLKLSEAAERFQEGKASLWKMPDLQLAINWREENRPTLIWGQRYNPAFERTMVFLETSEKAYVTEQRNKELLQKRQVKRMRLSAIILGAAALVSIFFVVYANIKSNEAQKASEEAKVQQELAVKNADDAEKQAALAEEQAALARKAENKATAALKEAEVAKIEAELQADIAKKQKAEADKQRQAAEEAQIEAAESAEQAKIEAEKARQAQAEALVAKDNADRLRLQSVAQSMAIKARNIPERELKAVVAKQAYDFYQQYGDPNKPYNGDIYAGVYSGLEGVLSTYSVNDDGEKVFKNNGDSVLNQYHGHLPVTTSQVTEEKISVRSVVFSEDGKRMYSAGSDGRLLMWDYASGKRTYVEIFHRNHVNRVVNVSPNERYLALGTDDNHILVVDLKNRDSEPVSINGHVGGTVYDLVFLPDNLSFISTGADSRILLHSLRTKETVQIAQTSSRAKTLAISPDAKTLAAGTESGEVMIIDLNGTDYPSRNIYRKNGSPAVHALHFSNGADKLAFGDDKGDLFIWDLVEKKQWGPKLTGFTSPISDIHFSPGDDLLAATSKDKTARMWDLNNIYDLPTVFDDHKDWVWSLDFHPSGQQFATGSADGIIRVFETKPDAYAERICGLVSANMSETQWRQYVGDLEQIPYEYTCDGLDKGDEIE